MQWIDRRKFFLFLAASIPALKGSLYAQEHGHDHGDDGDHGEHGDHREHGDHGEHDQHEEHGDHGDGRDHHFRQEDYGTVARYYRGPRDLPPGLAKKYYRAGTLPPGWQKRYQPFPRELVVQLPPLPSNYDRGFVDGQAIVYNRSTRVIVDVLDIAAALRSH